MYCVTKAEFFMGFEISEHLGDHCGDLDEDKFAELEIVVKRYPEIKIVYAMMGSESQRILIAAKDSYRCSDDMECIDIDSTLGDLYFNGPIYGKLLFDFWKKELPHIPYKNELIQWKLISSGWSST
jgi:hypothetical protein